MICQECGVRFSKTKIDRFEYKPQSTADRDDEDLTFCSESCAFMWGWQGGDDTSNRTAALLAELEHAVRDAPPSRAFTSRERQSLSDTLAIVNFETGAARKAGPPVTLPLIVAALKKLKAKGWFRGDLSLWPGTLAQLEETIAVLGDD